MKRALRLFVWVLLASAAVARADLTLQLTPSAPSAAPGAVLTFQGILTNTSTTDKLFLNDLQATLTGSAAANVTLKSNAFFGNVPGILLPGETYNGPLFQVKLGANAPAADYAGSVTIQGGADIFASATLATSSLALLATPVEQWRYTTFGVNANDPAAADLADWDHDGVPNLIEYALGMNATTADRSSLPAPLALNDHIALSFVPSASDLTYAVESSIDLIHWSTTDVEPLIIANPAPPNRLTFQYHQPLSLSGPVFLRIRVTR